MSRSHACRRGQGIIGTRRRKVAFLVLLAFVELVSWNPLRAQVASDTVANTADKAVLKARKLITKERLQKLPEAEIASWNSYLSKSDNYALYERKMLSVEVAKAGLTKSRPAPNNRKEFELPSKVATSWLEAPETIKLAEVVVSYQTPTGGWSKAVDYSKGPRSLGTHWTSQSDLGWHYCGTLDNRSTTEQVRFLAYMYSRNPEVRYREAVNRAIRWLLDAQYPNGGWPQVYPIESGYHEAITLNDNAMLHAIQTLQEIGKQNPPYEWIDEDLRRAASDAAEKGIECFLRAQVIIDGTTTVWCAQHDPLTLEPVAARLKEPPSLSGGESADLLKFLMRDAPDTPAIRKAILAGIAWFDNHKITGLKQTKNEKGGTDYVVDNNSDEVRWGRFYHLKTQKPIFAGAQDGVIYSSFSEMAKNNKVGYDYFTTRPRDILAKEVDRWKKRVSID